MYKFKKKLLATVLSLAFLSSMPCLAYAMPDEFGIDTQAYPIQDLNYTMNVEDENTADKLFQYNTLGGFWRNHDGSYYSNGSFLITVPRLITYNPLHKGQVYAFDEFDVDIHGVLTSGKKVKLTVEPSFYSNIDKSKINVDLRIGKDEWVAEEVFGFSDDENSIIGTKSNQELILRGLVNTSGMYNGYVVYTASLLDDDSYDASFYPPQLYVSDEDNYSSFRMEK